MMTCIIDRQTRTLPRTTQTKRSCELFAHLTCNVTRHILVMFEYVVDEIVK